MRRTGVLVHRRNLYTETWEDLVLGCQTLEEMGDHVRPTGAGEVIAPFLLLPDRQKQESGISRLRPGS